MEMDSWSSSYFWKDSDVSEVTGDSEEVEDVSFGGPVVEWQVKELAEKAKARPFITGIVLTVWSVAVVASTIRLLMTGDFLLAMPPALISLPLTTVLRYYYRSSG